MDLRQYTDISQINMPKLDKLQYYIYILENVDGYIKIGRTHDIVKRINSLSNSNTGGSQITRFTVSPPTYLKTIEDSMHCRFDKYRVEGEWFKGVTFQEVFLYLYKILDSEGYENANNLRREVGGYETKHRY